MANNYFQFRQFTIRQERCAMKVGTDGTLLGAWASAPQGACRILDIGTGTGLISLMMAQRFPEAFVCGIDIDEDAVCQAQENVQASPYADRVNIWQCDVSLLNDKDGYDVIVCNPPFFEDSLTCPDQQRTSARHTVTLSYQQLMQAAFRLLKNNGRLALVIPSESQSRIETEAALQGFFICRLYRVQTTPQKQPKRHLIEFTKHPVNEIDNKDVTLEINSHVRSPWYHQLTKSFYIK